MHCMSTTACLVVGLAIATLPELALAFNCAASRSCAAHGDHVVTTSGPQHNGVKSYVLARPTNAITALWVTVKCTNCKKGNAFTSFKVETASVAGGGFWKNIPELESQKSMCGKVCAHPVKAQYPLHGARLMVKCDRGGFSNGELCHYDYTFGFRLAVNPAPTPLWTTAPSDYSPPSTPQEEDHTNHREKSREIKPELSTTDENGNGGWGWDAATIGFVSVCILLLMCCVALVVQAFGGKGREEKVAPHTRASSGPGEWDAEEAYALELIGGDEGQHMWDQDEFGDRPTRGVRPETNRDDLFF